eukprot:TRINITY_DN11067_c0_g2_i3.p1 TRINITY_DN11067_c0_g2~~TRINITY_DN11067_c0_g2_i3.p1  ORF type:complete len:248 (+),score=62.18 TRINITY_DN11067_c0_g2_i3:116-859(+)
MNDSIIKELKNHPMPHNIPLYHFSTSPVKNEGLLLYESCEYVDKAIKLFYYGTDRYLNTYKKYQDIWNNLTHFYPQITEEFLKKGRNAIDVADLVLCADSEERRPYLVSDKVIERMLEFVGNVMIEELTITPISLNISLHNATREVVKWVDGIINKNSKVKYAVYGTHDTTLIFLMLGMNKLNETIKITKRPPLAGNMNFILDDQENIWINYCGELVHKEEYRTFREKFLAIGDIGFKTREAICKNG